MTLMSAALVCFLNFRRAQVLGLQGLSGRGSAAAVRPVAEYAIRFKDIGGIALSLGNAWKNEAECQDCEVKTGKRPLHVCSLEVSRL